MLNKEVRIRPGTTLNKKPTECTCLVAVRLYFLSSFEMPDMHTSQRCCTRKERPGPAVVMRSLTKEIAEITKD